MAAKLVDISGKRYGDLLVIQRVAAPENIRHRLSWWAVKCLGPACNGMIFPVRRDSLVSGAKRRCDTCEKARVEELEAREMKSFWSIVDNRAGAKVRIAK